MAPRGYSGVGYVPPTGDDLVLVTSDQRLLRAAQVEGVLTFNPETQTEGDLDALLGSVHEFQT